MPRRVLVCSARASGSRLRFRLGRAACLSPEDPVPSFPVHRRSHASLIIRVALLDCVFLLVSTLPRGPWTCHGGGQENSKTPSLDRLASRLGENGSSRGDARRVSAAAAREEWKPQLAFATAASGGTGSGKPSCARAGRQLRSPQRPSQSNPGQPGTECVGEMRAMRLLP